MTTSFANASVVTQSWYFAARQVGAARRVRAFDLGPRRSPCIATGTAASMRSTRAVRISARTWRKAR
jgi:hypothetical protein